ncbi:hypothetical protein [Halalkalicoccus jeotgali]|uniref:Uncharacterized protein n=1 Tax=Halalkalicoccus jeotgali (strain DSM 18796 / CECT 7217 / JCM 14584 / KCTC 4019 / B3) TaxID=795797 RepID=D8JD83_HALJB|nr:hypothetical protein [Halalkalicoccus jeotgali]ADJ17236.1 hypothetical protein HacjB3_19503 [Halalkalicoccus jeotgali B3]ELY41947.1 hypothetical protein C497_00055 [Halalkalicoccus jeotgali B3]
MPAENDPPTDAPRDLAEDIHQFLKDIDEPQAVYEKMQVGEFDEAFEKTTEECPYERTHMLI